MDCPSNTSDEPCLLVVETCYERSDLPTPLTKDLPVVLHHYVLKPLRIEPRIFPIDQPHPPLAVKEDIVWVKVKMRENKGEGRVEVQIFLRSPPDLSVHIKLVHKPRRELIVGSKRPSSLKQYVSYN